METSIKALKTPISKRLLPVRIYIDDVQSIYNILKNHCTTVKVRTDRYEVSDIDELKNLEPKEIHVLRLSCTAPYISIDFEPNGARLYFDDDSTLNRGILSKIEEVLHRRKRIGGIFTDLNGSFYLGIIYGACLALIIVFSEGLTKWVLYGLATTAWFLSLVYYYRMAFHTYSTVILHYRRERSNFFERNKDQILVGIFVAIVSVLLTVLVTKLVD